MATELFPPSIYRCRQWKIVYSYPKRWPISSKNYIDVSTGANAGTIVELDPSINTVVRSVSFPGTNPALFGTPLAAMTPDGAGKFYGTTNGPNAINPNASPAQSYIYQFDPAAGSVTSVVTLTNSTGRNSSALTPGASGKYYGVNVDGATSGLGSVYEFDSTTNSITKQLDFANLSGANLPGGGGNMDNYALTSNGSGLYYGIRNTGGANGKGFIYEFNPAGSGSFAIKANFDGITGPSATGFDGGPLLNYNGRFLGVSSNGGTNNNGSIFEFNPSNGSISVLASFTGSGANGDGASPNAYLSSAGNGRFYGVAVQGGVNNLGTIYQFDLNDPVPAPPAPGPLPLIGAGAALGWSRKLRRRLRLQQPGARLSA